MINLRLYRVNPTLIQISCFFCLAGDLINYFFPFQIFLIVPKLILVSLLFKYVKSILIIAMSGFLIFATLMNAFTSENIGSIISNFAFLFKIILFLYSLEFLLTKNVSVSRSGVTIVIAYFIFNIFLTWVGVGLVNYDRLMSEVPLGSKGIYQSGNEFGIAFTFITLLVLFNLRPNVIRDTALAVIGVAIATKVAIFATLSVIFYWIYLLLYRYNIFGLLVITGFLIGSLSTLVDYLSIRFGFDYSMATSMTTFLVSGRDARIIESLAAFVNSNTLSILFGLSFDCVAVQTCGGVRFVENDLVDLLLIYGVMPTLVVLMTLAHQVLLAWRISRGTVFSYVTLMGIAFVSGHVLYNPLLPILLLLAIERK